MIVLKEMPDVLCPRCAHPGGLWAYAFCGSPILLCDLCEFRVRGFWEGGDAVFPDAHVGQETGQVAQ
jgi:hypothetical protein